MPDTNRYETKRGPGRPPRPAYVPQQVGVVEGSWKEHALCKVLPPYLVDDLFFNVDTRDPLKRDREELCGKCPVANKCLAYGNIVSTEYGAWGGLTPDQRNLKRSHRRKND